MLERPVGKNMVNYPVGDFLIKIKNAALARRRLIRVPYSKLVYSVAMVLKKEKYLSEVKKEKDELAVMLTFYKKEPVLIDLKLVSKPSKRIYKGVEELKSHKGLSFLIVSTPKGIMTSYEAIKNNLGGEVIAEIF